MEGQAPAPTDAAVHVDHDDDGMAGASRNNDDALARAQDAYFEGRYSDAVDIAKEVLRASPTEPDAYEILAMALMQERNYELAAEVRCGSAGGRQPLRSRSNAVCVRPRNQLTRARPDRACRSPRPCVLRAPPRLRRCGPSSCPTACSSWPCAFRRLTWPATLACAARPPRPSCALNHA